MGATRKINPETYLDRPSSYIVAKLMETYGKSTRDISDAIDCSPETFKSKLKRSSFTMEEFIRIMDACYPREMLDLSPVVKIYDDGGIRL